MSSENPSDAPRNSTVICLDNKGPAFVVLTVRARRKPHLRPVLVVRDQDGEAAIPREPIEWIRNVLTFDSKSPAKMMLSTIGRLYEYTSIAFRDFELTAETLPTAVWNYTAFRAGERMPDDPDSQQLTLWNPVKRSTAISEFRTIVSYLQFCNDRFQSLLLLDRPVGLKNIQHLDIPTTSKRDFFLHLRGHRERYRKLLGVERYHPPRVTPSASLATRRSSQGRTMPQDEVDLIIGAEKNPSFKALWTLLAYGGMRVSEALNIWCVDIMPGSMIAQFERGFTQAEPLVILADPVESRFVGDFGDSSRTRLKYLRDKYGLVPRPYYPDKHPMRAGWKSVLVSNKALSLSWVYWSEPQPAQEFLELTAMLLNLRRQHPTTTHHPYFFINTSNNEYGGQPLKYSNTMKAFERACVRVDLEPHMAGRTLHGFRHFYRDNLRKRLKLPPEIIQVMMHHKSVVSQEDYGNCEYAFVHKALREAFARERTE
ncbi:site-specific integrase [Afipia felis]|uniref:Site-specific recombinase XerD n=2 Tax=Afipia felis TaxID=1035 RepID=A0A380W4I4_AFIFE|nr:site-specific integrase [Afipia felis]EKS31067.1 hypothetical protein HMPREF9697_03595 [Afipia felis ATCC 53690]SUU75811.1 Site-specific recombinase XerD [Afipia felis]SUU83878.1 Site-specific recombinase XerD [Afipia felis]